MDDTAGDQEFWLPPEFLTDYDILMDKHIFNKNGLRTELTSNLCLPTEFPFFFGSFGSSSAVSSPVESVFGSTDTESDEENSLAGLTRSSVLENRKPISNCLDVEKGLVLSGSPQSTLATVAVGSRSGRSTVTRNGSPNRLSQVLSSPTTPLGVGNGDAWDLITQPAGHHVARLEMYGDVGAPLSTGGLVDSPRSLRTHVQPPPPLKNSNSASYNRLSFINYFHELRQEPIVKQQVREVLLRLARERRNFHNQVAQCSRPTVGICFGGGGGGALVDSGKCGRPLGLPQSAWPALEVQNLCHNGHYHHHNPPLSNGGPAMRTVHFGGSGGGGVKRESAGTGVFLPRRYISPSESCKKTGFSTALLPANVVRAPNKHFQDMNAHAQPLHQPRFNGSGVPGYDLMMARRNVLLTQQKQRMHPDGAMNHEACLPQEWTY